MISGAGLAQTAVELAALPPTAFGSLEQMHTTWLLLAAARGAAGAGWADEIAAALPNSTLWQATWTQLGARWPEHSLSAAEKRALLVPLAREGPAGSPLAGGVFPFFEANAPDQLRSQLDNLHRSADAAARRSWSRSRSRRPMCNGNPKGFDNFIRVPAL